MATRQKLINLHSKEAASVDKLITNKSFGEGEIAVRNADAEVEAALYVKSGNGLATFETAAARALVTDEIEKAATALAGRVGVAEGKINDIVGGTSAVTSFGEKKGEITLDTDASSYDKVKLSMEGNELQGTLNVGTAAQFDEGHFALKSNLVQTNSDLAATEAKAEENKKAIGTSKGGLIKDVADNKNAISQEKVRATKKEGEIDALIGEKDVASDTSVFGAIKAETDRAELAENGLNGKIDTLESFKTAVLDKKDQVVNSIANTKGDLTLRGGQVDKGSVNLAMSGEQIQASIVGLGTAAYETKETFVTQEAYDAKISTLESKDTELANALGSKGVESDSTAFGLIDKNAKEISSIKTSIKGGTHFKGVMTTKPAVDAYHNGDIIAIVGGSSKDEGKEFILSATVSPEGVESGKKWIELGDTTAEQTRITANEDAIKILQTADTAFGKQLGEGFNEISTVASQIAEAKAEAKKATSVVEGSTNITVTANPNSGRGTDGVTYTVSAKNLALQSSLDATNTIAKNNQTKLVGINTTVKEVIETAEANAKAAGKTKVVSGGNVTATVNSKPNSDGHEEFTLGVKEGFQITTTDEVAKIGANEGAINDLKADRIKTISVKTRPSGVSAHGITVETTGNNGGTVTTPVINIDAMVIDCGTY